MDWLKQNVISKHGHYCIITIWFIWRVLNKKIFNDIGYIGKNPSLTSVRDNVEIKYISGDNPSPMS